MLLVVQSAESEPADRVKLTNELRPRHRQPKLIVQWIKIDRSVVSIMDQDRPQQANRPQQGQQLQLRRFLEFQR